MGFPTTIFLEEPDASLTCSICQDVLEDPRSLRCGHSFCADCLRDQRAAQLGRLRVESNDDDDSSTSSTPPQPPCPSCRGPGGDLITNYVCREVICSLRICCKNVGETRTNGDDDADGRRVRRRPNENASACACDWTGRIDEWQRHADEECRLHVIKCDVPGCGTTCRRNEMSDHRRSDACIEARIEARVSAAVAAVEEKFAKELADLKEKARNTGSNGGYVLSFCREWMKTKPDPLFNFVVYREKIPHGSDDLTRLLVGIPGPLRTPWEGGLFPMMMEWEWGIDKPPKCQFPPGFHLPNVSTTGTVYILNLDEEESWRPDISIPELLFSIQQIIAHPDIRSPLQPNGYQLFMHRKDEYDRIAQEHARKYQPGRFLELAREAFRRVEDLPLILVESQQQEAREAPVEPPLSALNKDPVQKRPCVCSCCAWGTTTGGWDSRLQMRFLFCGSCNPC